MNLRDAAQAALEAIRIFREWEMGQDYDSNRETVLARAFAAEELLAAALTDDALDRMAKDERELGIQMQTHSADCWRWHHECAVAKIQIMRTPLTEQQLEQATREVRRNVAFDFDYTPSSWIEAGIRYAERAHHIGDSPCAS